MPTFSVAPCTIEDGPALARNNMSAFWEDPTWVLIWREKTLDHIIAQATLRLPHLLLTDTAHRRHQKAIDVVSGAVVGYARWILPDVDPQATKDSDVLWPEARAPAASEEREREAERAHAAADWNRDHTVDALDVPVLAIKNRLMKRKPYLRKFFHVRACSNRETDFANPL